MNIEYVNLQNQPFILDYQHRSTGEEWTKFHAHQGMEFLFIVEGAGKIVVNRKIFPVSSNMLVIFQPYQLHKVQMYSQKIPYLRSILNFDPLYLESFIQPFQSLYSYYRHIWKSEIVKPIFPLQRDGRIIASLFERLHNTLDSTSLELTKEKYVLFMLSLLQIISTKNETMDSRVFGEGRPLRISEKIMEWMEDHYKEEFSLDSLGQDLHLSTYHLSHVFSEETGTSITAYKNGRRLREACQLLCTSDYTIRVIAEKSGFTDISYFSQLFKKQIGISPKEYRLSSAEQFV